MSESIVNSLVVGVVTMFLAFLSAWFWFQKTQAVKAAELVAEGHEKLVARVIELEAQARVAQATFLPIWAAAQAKLAASLTHDHTEATDELLVKAGNGTLTAAEKPILLAALIRRITDEDHLVSGDERENATIFPIVMKRAEEEEAERERLEIALKSMLVTPIVLGPEKEGLK